jgi:hypothetical protein
MTRTTHSDLSSASRTLKPTDTLTLLAWLSRGVFIAPLEPALTGALTR